MKNLSSQLNQQTIHYLDVVKAFARASYESIYVVNWEDKVFEYVSDNPLFLSDHTADEIKKMGYTFFFKYALDINFLIKVRSIGDNFCKNLSPDKLLKHTISYDYFIRTRKGEVLLINQKTTPILLTETGEISKLLCFVSLSNSREPGNIRIHKEGSNKVYHYNPSNGFWETNKNINLTSREKEIVLLASRGYTINEIANLIFVTPDTIKFHRRKLFAKLNVRNMPQAIVFAVNNKLI